MMAPVRRTVGVWFGKVPTVHVQVAEEAAFWSLAGWRAVGGL